MRTKTASLKFLVSFFSIIALVGLIQVAYPSHVLASSLCPAGYNDKQCYDYLTQKQAELLKKRKDLENSLRNVKGQEGDVQSQLNQINAQIADREAEIDQKQVEMELTSIDIRNIGADISAAKTKIDTLKQENQKIVDQINNSMLLSYKITSVPSWYYLASTDLITSVEMMSYVNYVVDQEKARMNSFKQLQNQLSSEEQTLAISQNDIITKRNSLEQANLDLIKLQNDLRADSDKQSKLLAQLKESEKQLQAQASALQKQQNSYDAEAIALAVKLFQSGQLGVGTPVNKGDIIAFQGHTGCAFGSHLHFGIINGRPTRIAANVNPFASNYLNLSGNYITSDSGRAPLGGALMTQGFHEGYAIDMLSTTEGNQSGSKYFVKVGDIKCAPTYGNVYHNLRGEGAPVRAVLSGTIYRGNRDRWGSNYIIIDHGNNLLSFYFHLK